MKKFQILFDKKEENILYWAGLIALPIGLLFLQFLFHWVIPNFGPFECKMYQYFGVYCPGCGGTRSVQALMRGDILLSLWYHPLILYFVVIYVWYMITHTLEKLSFFSVKGLTLRTCHLYAVLLIMAVNCIGKNILKFYFHIPM